MRPPTPAALALLGAGIQPKAIAEAIGVTPQAVSYQLAGRTAQTSTELLEAVAERGGPELAETVARLIAVERERRTA